MDEKELDLSSWSVEGQETVGSGYEDSKENKAPKPTIDPKPSIDSDENNVEPKTPQDPIPPQKIPGASQKDADQKNDIQSSTQKGINWGWILVLVIAAVAAGFLIYYFGYHDWSSATCSSPSECRICGRTKGAPLGHNWQAATCQTPKTCSRCGRIEGTVAEHEWQDATCQTPKTCIWCGRTEGTVADHEWQAATCQTPQTCRVCGLTTGTTLDHEWQAATCQTPQTCRVCGLTTGTTLDHEWQAATCQTPKTCSLCGKTEGNLAAHSWKEATCQNPRTCSQCGKTEGDLAAHSWKEATWTEPKTCTVCGKTEGKNQKETMQITLSFAVYDLETGKISGYVNKPLDDPYAAAAEISDGQGLSITPKIENKGETSVKGTFIMLFDGQQVVYWDFYEYNPGTSIRLSNKYSKTVTAGKHTYEFWFNDEVMGKGELDIPFDLPHVHSWQEATCQNPKTCSVCRKTEGDLGGHHWKEATWTKPMTCTVCGITDGKAKKENVSISIDFWVYDRETRKPIRRAQDPLSNEVLKDGECVGLMPSLVNEGQIPFSSDIYVYVDDQEVFHSDKNVVFDQGEHKISSYPIEIKGSGSHKYSVVVDSETAESGDFFFPESWK